MILPTTEEVEALVKSKLKTFAAANLSSNPDVDSMYSLMERWVRLWQPVPQDDAYKRPVFESYGMVYYTPKDGASMPRYGVQAILKGPLFESRKEFRSRRLAKLWIKEQMKCKCWPVATNSTPDNVDERTVVTTFTFDYEGFLDKTFLVKNEDFR